MGVEERRRRVKGGVAGWGLEEGVKEMEALAERLNPLDDGMVSTTAHVEEEGEGEEEGEEEEEGTGGGEGGSRSQEAGTDPVLNVRNRMGMTRGIANQ
jgi:hypothetical protein